jgi:nucleoside 2-deoxyribosyltransferase
LLAIHQKSPQIFVCGPISNAIRAGQFDPSVRRLIEAIIQELENAGFRVASAHREENYGGCIPISPEEVFRRDLNFARTCSAMVVVLPSDERDQLYRTDGTFMELGWALVLGKPLVIVADLTATDRSYLFDGLLRLSCVRLLEIDEVLKGKKLTEILWQAISGVRSLGTGNDVYFRSTSSNLGSHSDE